MESSAASDRRGRTHRIEGRLFQAGSSSYTEAALLFGAGSVCQVYPDGSTGPIHSMTELRIDRPVTGLPRRLTFRSGEVFECDDHDAVEAALALAERRDRRRPASLGLSPAKWAFLIVAAVLMPIALWYLYPLAADGVAQALPRSVDRAIGQSTFEQMDGTLFLESRISPRRKSELNEIFHAIVRVSDLSPEDVRLRYRKGRFKGLDQNAIALPDGTIVLFDGLVALAEHDDELAGVLAHEVGHVQHRHSVRKIARAAGLGILVTIFLGDSSSLLEELAATGAAVAELSYSREFETEADRVSADIMRKLGRDPEGMITLLRRVLENCGEDCEETGLLSSHPGLRDRLESVGGGRE